MGALAAVFAAIDGGQKLWGENAFWDSDAVRHLYDWRSSLKLAASAVALSLAIVIAPLAAVAIGAIVYPFDFIVRMFGLGGASGVVGAYTRFADRLFAPSALPTWLPRLVVIVLGLAAVTIAIEALVSTGRRRERGSLWWKALRAPLSSREVLRRSWTAMWELVQGLDPGASHASWMENFPWTRLDGVELPADRKEPLRQPLPATPAAMREVAGDGQYGGFYVLPDTDALRLWAAGVQETRELLASGWRR